MASTLWGPTHDIKIYFTYSREKKRWIHVFPMCNIANTSCPTDFIPRVINHLATCSQFIMCVSVCVWIFGKEWHLKYIKTNRDFCSPLWKKLPLSSHTRPDTQNNSPTPSEQICFFSQTTSTPLNFVKRENPRIKHVAYITGPCIFKGLCAKCQPAINSGSVISGLPFITLALHGVQLLWTTRCLWLADFAN